jgi:hypothetical protein
MLDFDLEQDERTAVKTAMALAVSRYTDTVGKFVQNKPDRLSIVSVQVERIARECAEAARADEGEVVRLFNQYLADSLPQTAVSEPEKQNVTDTAEYNNSDEVPASEDKAHPSEMTDVKDTEAVLDDDPAEHLDMNTDTDIKSHDFISRKVGKLDPEDIPEDHPVQPIDPDDKSAEDPATCGTCGLTWDDGKSTGWTPAPSGRCPFEYFHKYPEDSEHESKVANQISCPYCGHLMTPVQDPSNPANSGNQQRCPSCGATIQSTPGMTPGQPMPGGIAPPPSGAPAGGLYPQQQQGYAKCARCEDETTVEGSILCEACNNFVVTGEEDDLSSKECDECGHPAYEHKVSSTGECEHDGCSCGGYHPVRHSKVAQDGGDVSDPDLPMDQSQSPAEEDPTEQQLPPAVKEDSNGPAEVYTGVVTQTANQNAAMAWSTPGDDDIQQISQQYGLQPDQVRKDLRIVADFGDALAVNGDPNGDPNMDGYTELDGFGGRIPTTEEEVDVDNAIQHTADRTNLSPDDVYALVKESYGGDLGGQHYVSVSGEAHYYLPANLVQQQPQQQAQPPQAQPADPAQQAMQSHLTSLASFMEWEKAQLAHRDA